MIQKSKYAKKLSRAGAALLSAATVLSGAGNAWFTSPVSILAESSQHSVSLDAGQGSVAQSSIQVDEQGHIIGSLPVPQRSGWVFDGWYTAEVSETLDLTDPTKSSYWTWNIQTSGQPVSQDSVLDQGVTTLYAKYRPTVVNFKIHAAGWQNENGALKVSRQYGVPFAGIVYGWNLPEINGEYKGYVFDGWYDALNGGNPIRTVGEIEDSLTSKDYTPMTGQFDLYVHWHKKDGSFPQNQAEWSNAYSKSSTIISSISANVKEPCIRKEVELTAYIPNTDNFWSHLNWKVVEGDAILQGYSAKKCLVKANKAGKVVIEATLTDGDNQGKTIENKRKQRIEIDFHDHDAAHLKKIEYNVVKNKWRSYDYCEICHLKLNEKEYTKGSDPDPTPVPDPAPNTAPAVPSTPSTSPTTPSTTEPAPTPSEPAQDTTSQTPAPQNPQPAEPSPAEPSQPSDTVQQQPQQPSAAPEKNEVPTVVPEPPVLSETVVDSKTETNAAGNLETIMTYDDGHTNTKVESVQASTNYVESADHSFAGAEIDIKDTENPEVKVEIKAIPLSMQASQPIVLNMPETGEKKVSIPVENGNWGTVALLVDEFGETHEINASYYDGNGNIVVPVLNNMKVVLQNKALTFADVPGSINEYPANNIAFLSARGIMSGKGDGTNFDPTGEITRGQLALMLYRIAGEPETFNNDPAPAGVAEDSYYANAAKWAVGNGLMGQGGSAFNGDRAIKRENLALILYRQSRPDEVSIAALGSYSDVPSISSTDAATAIAWSIENKIMGNGTTTLNPQSQSMRQEVAAMIARWIQPAIAEVN